MEQLPQRGSVPQIGAFHTPRLCNGRRDRTVPTVRCTGAGGHRSLAASESWLHPLSAHPTEIEQMMGEIVLRVMAWAVAGLPGRRCEYLERIPPARRHRPWRGALLYP